jgi:purine nucleoside permease
MAAGEIWEDPTLAEWAFEITKAIPLSDSAAMTAFRAGFTQHPQARKPPGIIMGDTLASSTYWHGAKLNQWANDWVQLHAGRDANFVTSNMEDSGTLTAIHRLARSQLADSNRVLVLRTVSNYSLPAAGKTAAWSTTADYPDNGLPALEAAFTVGNTLVQALLQKWSQVRNEIPGAPVTTPATTTSKAVP